MPRLRTVFGAIQIALFLAVIAEPRAAWAQFSWDGDCSILWTDCCNYGTPENPEWHNNWTIAPNFTTCPALPGVNDDVFAGGTIMLTSSTNVKSVSVAGTFLFNGGLARTLQMTNDLTITGSPVEPTTFVIQGGPYNIVSVNNANATATISSFATLEFQSSGAVYGPQTAMLYNNGLIWKTGESVQPPGFPPLPNSLNIPVENNGTISCWQGTLTLAKGGTNNGVIEALGEGIVAFKGPATYVLDGEVRGDGLIRFLSTFSGGGVSIIGDYHPTNTLIAGGYLPVNFDVNTHIENLTLDNPGILGGAADLTINNLTWYGTTTMSPGGTTIVLDNALFEKDIPNNGSLVLNRDMELYGESTIALNTILYIDDGELRNYGELQMLGNSSIAQLCCLPDSLVQNFGTLRKVSGAPSLINVVFLNIGEVAVESGTLHFDGEMISDGPITVNAGATLGMGHKQQTNFTSGSITGEGNVWFYNDFHSADETVDSILGIYNVGTTTIQAAAVDFQTDGVIAPQKTTATLNMIQGLGTGKVVGDADLIVTDQFNWSAGEMAGEGTTFVHGPMVLTGTTSLDRLLELNVTAEPGKNPPTWTLFIKPLGTLHCKDVTIDGYVNNDGLISPGTPTAPVGQLHLTGGYTQTPGGQLSINKLGPSHDQLIVDGLATLGGTLNAIGFPPSGGQSFTILTAANVNGAFAQVNAPSGMQVVYTATSVTLQAAPGTPCPADIAPGSGNGIVNVDDLLAVINSWGACANPNACPADVAPFGPPQGDDVVNVDDLLAVINAWGPCP